MFIAKPLWLQEWLRERNYEILGIPLLFGDWIETAIDWLLSPINYIAEWVTSTYNWLVDFWSEIHEWIDKLELDIGKIWDWIVTEAGAIWNILTEWWEGTRTTVLGWIDTATQGFNDLKAAWNTFWTITFPNLVSFQWLTNWWGGKLSEIDALIKSRLQEWFPFYNALFELWNEIVDFFKDPLDWCYHKLDEFFERFW